MDALMIMGLGARSARVMWGMSREDFYNARDDWTNVMPAVLFPGDYFPVAYADADGDGEQDAVLICGRRNEGKYGVAIAHHLMNWVERTAE